MMIRSITRSILVVLLAVTTLSFTSCSSSKPARRTQTYSAPPKIVFKPRVTIRNNSRKKITIGLRGPETRFVTIPARSSRSLNLRSGAYKYAAAARNSKTISGYKYFGTNKKYTWNFNAR